MQIVLKLIIFWRIWLMTKKSLLETNKSSRAIMTLKYPTFTYLKVKKDPSQNLLKKPKKNVYFTQKLQ